jgi:hypothetical protein
MKQKWNRTIGGVVIGLLVGALAFAGIVQAAPDGAPLLAPVGTAFTYQGYINDNGSPANGNYNLRFNLYDSASTGTQVGSTVTKNTVAVSDGYFTVELDFGDVFDGTALWLAIEIQGPGDPGYTALSPRQALNAAPFALYALNIPAHNHFGETWSGTATYGLRVDNADIGIYGRTTSSTGVLGYSIAASSSSSYGVRGVSTSTNGKGVAGVATSTSGATRGVYGNTSSPDGIGVWGASDASSGDSPGVAGVSIVSPDGRGVYGTGAYGVYGETWHTDGTAVYGESMTGTGTNYGVYGKSNSSNGYGGYFVNNGADGTALYATGSGSWSPNATLRVDNTEAAAGVAAKFTNDSNGTTAMFSNDGSGDVLYLMNGGTDAGGAGGGDFIRALNEPGDDVQFRVSSGGYVYADGGYNCGLNIVEFPIVPVVPSLPPAFAVGALTQGSIEPCLRDNTPADFAEMFLAQGSPEPGDVLAIGPDGYLTQSSEAYQTTVIGVYSFRPSYLGNAQFADVDGYVPLAMLGIVPVKVSAENGAIQPGDLLVASSTPGHAMKASENPPQGSVIGKALEPLTEGTGFIQMIVTLQ